MTNLTARPDARPGRRSQPAPHHDRETPALPAAASSASTLGAPEMARSAGTDGQAEPSPDAATATTATPARAIAMARRGQAGRQACRSRQRDRDIRDRRFAEAAPPTTAVMASTADHVAAG